MGFRYQNKFAAMTTVKMIFVLLFFSAVFFANNFFYADAAAAPPTGLDKAFDTTTNMPLEAVAIQGAGYNTTATFATIVSKVLTVVLELMGVIFLVLGVYGGYSWMTAGGNEETVNKAKQTITNAIIGMIVVLAAYAISRFVVKAIGDLVFK